jgi:hypothetical protein
VLDGPNSEAVAATLVADGGLEVIVDLITAALPARAAAPEPAPAPEPAQPGPTPADPGAAVLLLARRLRGGSLADRDLRIRQAYSLGRSDAEQALGALAGQAPYQEPTPPREARRCSAQYVVLHGPPSAPFYTDSATYYFNQAKPGGEWLPFTVSRCLGSRCELDAYFAGVGGPVPYRSLLQV